MGRTPKIVPIEDRRTMCEMQKQGLGSRIISRKFNGAYHPSHVTRLLTKCPELLDSSAGREAVADVLAPAQTLYSPNLRTSTIPAPSLPVTTLRVGLKSSDRTRPRVRKPQVKNSAGPANSSGSPGDDGDDDELDESDEIDFDLLNGPLTPIPTQSPSFYPGLVNPFTVLERTAADVFNTGIIQTAGQFYDNLSRRLFPNLHPDQSYKAEIQELMDRFKQLNMKQIAPNLEETGASQQQPPTCTGYCEADLDEIDSSVVDDSGELKVSGVDSNLTPDQSTQKQTIASDSERQTLVGKKVSDIDKPILPLKIPDVPPAGKVNPSDSLVTSIRIDSRLAGQNMTEPEKIIEPKSVVVTQLNRLESESVNPNAVLNEERTDRPHPTTPSPVALTGNAIGDMTLSTSVVQPLNDIQPSTPALISVKDKIFDPVLSRVADSQPGKHPPAVIEAAKSEFSSLAPSDVPVEPKAVINQTISTSSLDDSRQNPNQPSGTSQNLTEADHMEDLCERNRTVGENDSGSMKEENDAPWWLSLALGVVAAFAVTFFGPQMQQSSIAKHGTPGNIGPILGPHYTSVLGRVSPPSKKSCSPLYSTQTENAKIVF